MILPCVVCHPNPLPPHNWPRSESVIFCIADFLAYFQPFRRYFLEAFHSDSLVPLLWPAPHAANVARHLEPPKPSGTGSFCGVFGAKCACPPLRARPGRKTESDRTKTGKNAAGAFENEQEDLAQLRASIYRDRGRPEVEE